VTQPKTNLTRIYLTLEKCKHHYILLHGVGTKCQSTNYWNVKFSY